MTIMRFNSTFVLICAVFLFAGCASVTITLPEGVKDQIPQGANRIDVITDQTVDELYNSIQQWLPAQGFTIESANEITRRVETAPGEIGQRSRLKLTLRVNPYERGSRLEAIGMWTSDIEEATYESAGTGVSGEDKDWFAAIWTGAGRSSYAYAKLVEIFYDMPATEKRYIKQ